MLCYDVAHNTNSKLDIVYIYTLLHKDVLQVVSTMQWIQMIIYNGLHETYIHTIEKVTLMRMQLDCKHLLMAGEH